jgi:hypothetical protein
VGIIIREPIPVMVGDNDENRRALLPCQTAITASRTELNGVAFLNGESNPFNIPEWGKRDRFSG